MLRPWVPLIALGLLFALGYALGQVFLADLGGLLLAAALVSELAYRLGGASAASGLKGWRARREHAKALKKAARLDWTVIDNSVSGKRLKRDCERPETMGICTGLDCLVYKTCDFNIKKPLP